jgi:hypothetical protein
LCPAVARVIAASILCLFVVSCSCQPDDAVAPQPVATAAPSPKPVILVAADGLEWDVILPLLHKGRLPTIASLMQRGSYGLLRARTPTVSPVIWTTIATGKLPNEHGVLNMVKPGRPGDPPQLYTGRDRRAKAFWNILSDYDRRVAVVGWWGTNPVEPVNGVMVGQITAVADFDAAGQVHPPDRRKRYMEVLRQTDASLDEVTGRIFGAFPFPMSPVGQRLWNRCRRTFRADATYVQIARELLQEGVPYDLLAVCVGGADVTGRRFWRYMSPGEFTNRPSPEQTANFCRVIQAYYEYIDRTLGELVSLAGRDARVIVVSDHGMATFNANGAYSQDDPLSRLNSGHHRSAGPGVIIVAGPGIAVRNSPVRITRLERFDLQPLATALDITPTLLALLHVPVGEDHLGEVRENLVDPLYLARHPIKTVPTHDGEEWLAARPGEVGPVPGQEQLLEHVRSLGYLEDR